MANSAELNIVINADDRASGVLGKVSGTLGTLGTAVGAFALAGAGAFAAFGAASVGVAASFEKSLSSIEAVSGATAAEMEKISALSLQLGADTAFSAGEAAAGLEELIKGGLSTADAMAAAHPMLNLAAAGGIEVAAAAEIAANALGIFGLKGADMTNVANQIAGAANASSLSVTDFQFSMSAAGSVAAGVGQSFDDLATAIAVMGKSGIKGSDAGTSLKTMLMNLQPTTKAQIATFRELGITHLDNTKMAQAFAQYGLNPLNATMEDAEEQLMKAVTGWDGLKKMTKEQTDTWQSAQQALGLVTNEFVNADGSFKSNAEIAEVLQNATAGLTDAQRALAVETMFGSDAIRAANIFIKEGAEGFDTMATSMGKVTAESVAATRLDNFSGAIDAMKGSLETLQIVIGTALLPVLTTLVKDHLTPIINNASAFATAFFDAGDKMGFLVGKINEVIPGFQGFVAFVQGDVIPMLRDGLASTLTFINEHWESFKSTIIAVGSLLGGTVVMGAITAVVGALGMLVSPIGLVIAAAVALGVAWGENWGGIQEKTAAVFDWLSGTALPALQAAFQVAWPIIQQAVAATWEYLQTTVFPNARTMFGELVETLGMVRDKFVEVWPTIRAAIVTVVDYITGTLWPNLKAIWADWMVWQDNMQAKFEEVWPQIKAAVQTAVNWIVDTAAPAVQNAFNNLKTWIGEVRARWDSDIAAIRGFITSIQTTIETVRSGVEVAIGVIKSLFSSGWEAVQSTIQGVFSTIGGYISGPIDAAKNAVQTAISIITSAIQGAIDLVNNLIGLINRIPAIPDLPSIPGFAGGVQNFRGGMALVGERGPELVRLPHGADVYSNQRTQAMLTSGPTITMGDIHIYNPRNADDVTNGINAALMQMGEM